MFPIQLPAPFQDENCYSILCRYAVRCGRHNAHRVCRELFGHAMPLSGFLFKPFRIVDIRRWENREPGTVRYGADHSCLQYFSAFMEYEDAVLLRKCVEGSVMTSGQEKRISGKCGFSKIRKKRLWYCPECVKEDIRKSGDTCWRRMPQMPGVSYCTKHRIRLAESGLETSKINYQMFPAAYVLDRIPDSDDDYSGNIFEEEFLQLAEDVGWLLQKGFGAGSVEMLMDRFLGDTGKSIKEWRLPPAGVAYRDRFENFLSRRIMKECGSERIDVRTQRFLSMILSIEKEYGSMEGFYEESAASLPEE